MFSSMLVLPRLFYYHPDCDIPSLRNILIYKTCSQVVSRIFVDHRCESLALHLEIPSITVQNYAPASLYFNTEFPDLATPSLGDIHPT